MDPIGHEMEIPPLAKQIVPYHLILKLAKSQGLLGLFHHGEKEVGRPRIGDHEEASKII